MSVCYPCPFGDWWWQPNRGPDDRPAARPLSEEVEKMWVYRQQGDVWLVGYWSPDRVWFTESDHAGRGEAAARVRWLNGGD